MDNNWNNGWPQPNQAGWPNEAENLEKPLIAKKDCCEEASTLSHNHYIPCNKPAVNIVGWIGRSDTPIRMCQFCSNHNVSNRGGYVVSVYPDQFSTFTNPTPFNPWDAMSEDQLLMLWDYRKKVIETAKSDEMELRKYIVNRAFPKKEEGTNRKELGQGYDLKAVVRYNYTLADNDKVEECLNHISALGNEGPFIADRLVSWKPSFLKTEYNDLLERKDKGDERAVKILKIIEGMLTISEGAPTLDIVEPKGKKK